MKKCEYCKTFQKAESINKVRKKNEDVKKICEIQNKTISAESPHCKYFDPVDNFFCDIFHERYPILICLSRRKNINKLLVFKPCLDCRQFEGSIKEIIVDYHINLEPIIEKKVKKLKIRRTKRKDKTPKVKKSKLKYRRKK